MNVSNCRGCGRLFNALSDERICPACRQALDEKFQQVKQYLEEKPNSTVDQVSKDNEVSIKQIKQWIREERLTFSDGSLEGIDCEYCGKMIKTGRFCDECKSRMTNRLMSAYDKPEVKLEPRKEKDNKSRMRFL